MIRKRCRVISIYHIRNALHDTIDRSAYSFADVLRSKLIFMFEIKEKLQTGGF